MMQGTIICVPRRQNARTGFYFLVLFFHLSFRNRHFYYVRAMHLLPRVIVKDVIINVASSFLPVTSRRLMFSLQ
jgi:hypothetical protein